MQTFRLNFVFFSLYLLSWVIEYFIIFKVQNYLLGTISLYFPMLIFIPHGIRVIGAMVYGPKIFLGLLTAHFVTGYFFLEDLTMILILSTLSVVAAYIAVYLVFKKFNLNSDDIVVNKIILIAIISSILLVWGEIPKNSLLAPICLLKGLIGPFVALVRVPLGLC